MIKWHGVEPPWLVERLFILGLGGSHSYGTNTPESDVDYKGITIPPKSYYFGIKNFDSYHSPEGKDPDIVVYSLKKYTNLAMQANPNVLELLFLSPKHYIYVHPIAQELIENRNLFLTQLCHRSFTGYALSQLKRMKNRKGRPNHGAGSEKREQRIEKYGYDTKNGLHLIRLLKMGIEILRDGNLTVDRQGIDAEELKAIGKGAYALEELIQYGESLLSQADYYLKETKLPKKPI